MDLIDAWFQWHIRDARRSAARTGGSVEVALLRRQSGRVNDIRVIFPGASVPALLNRLVWAFDALPDEEKTPLAGAPSWTEEVVAWVRGRLNQDRHAVHAEGFEFPASLLTPDLFSEAAERFPGQETVGCVFTTAVALAFEGRESAERLPLFSAQTVPPYPTLPLGKAVRALYTTALRAQDPEFTKHDVLGYIASELGIDTDMVDPAAVLVERWVLDYGARAADFRGATDAWGRVGALAASAPEAFRRDTGKEPPGDLVTRVERAAYRMLDDRQP